MRSATSAFVVAIALFFICSLSATRVEATLGEPATSIDNDQQAMAQKTSARIKRTTTAKDDKYLVDKMEVGPTVVHQFVSKSSNVVFGLVSRGHPDLKQLLGTYYQDYEQGRANTPRRRGRGPLVIKTDRFVFIESGAVRNIQYEAYDPRLLPEGVSEKDIKFDVSAK